MKYLSRLMALLCVMALFAAPCLAQDISEYDANLQATLEAAQALTDEFLAFTDLEAMYDRMYEVVLSETEKPLLNALSTEQVKAISDHANGLYLAIEAPNSDDFETLEMTVDMLSVARNGSEAEMMAAVAVTTATYSGNNTANALTVDRDITWTLQNNATITVNGCITVSEGKTLTIKGNGSFLRSNTYISKMFDVKGTLKVEGSSETERVVIDGSDVIANQPMIVSNGQLEFKFASIQNGKNRSINSNNGKPNGQGGGIRVDAGSLTMDYCVVTRNTASLNGGGISCQGTMNVSNSTISYNVAASAETGPSEVNAGRGGGFDLVGTSAIGTLTNVSVDHNAAMYYGGGGQITGGAQLTMRGTTVFSNNTAILHGAGALHVTGDSTFTMEDGSMKNNTAQTVGGAIHSSYKCRLNLNNGTISGNTANGRGGGVHVNTGGAVKLGGGLTISGNKAYDQATGSSADLDATGDKWSNVQKNGAHNDNGYGGGVLIDSGTCTVEGATISGNHAEVGGGGIALVMLNVSSVNALKQLMLVNFEMTSGIISDNTTDGNGAGVYLMRNKLKESIISYYGAEGTADYEAAIKELNNQNYLTDMPQATVSGGTVKENKADGNGGGLYLGEKTKFEMSGEADFVGNIADNGGAVYIEKGIAEISGGTMSANTARENGGAIWITGLEDSDDPTIIVTAGTIGGDSESDANKAVNGGAVYVNGGQFTMTDGSITNNNATAHGGAVYVDGGQFTMTNGEISHNTAAANGGAAYVSGGDFEMSDGTVSNNTALNGGAAYISGGNFKMISGEMTQNEAIEVTNGAAEEGTEGYGGAVYAAGGNIYIGVEGCTGTGDKHTVSDYTDYAHPKVNGNTAVFGGALAVNGGEVHIYCGEMTSNHSNNDGTGMNVFMTGDESKIYHYLESAQIGESQDHGMVSVGGELTIVHGDQNQFTITITYFSNEIKGDDGVEITWTGIAPDGYVLNLPYCPAQWQDVQGENGLTFVGWASDRMENQANEIRAKDDYYQIGTPMKIEDIIKNSNTENGDMYFYAVWAPKVNSITYAYTLDKNESSAVTTWTDAAFPETYEFEMISNTVPIGPAEKAGYTFLGWRIYASNEKISNWDADAKSSDKTVDALEDIKTYADYVDYNGVEGAKPAFIGTDSYLPNNTLNTMQNFGDIVLVAVFEPAFSGLRIIKEVPEGTVVDQNFIFSITGTPNNEALDPVDMQVALAGTGSQLIYLPVGDYTVTELEDWSWRYDVTDVGAETKDMQEMQLMMLADSVEVVPYKKITINDPTKGIELTFTNTRIEEKWLDGSAIKTNELKGD